MGLKWKKKTPVNEYNEFDTLTNQLAAIYGIEDVNGFLNPTKKELHNPLLLKNITYAVNEIEEALKKNKKISIHIDVDSDGCTSGTLMYGYLKRFTDNVTYFHAQRSSGHGVEISESELPTGTELLIIIDSSTNSVESCKRISESGVTIIILDHHEQDVENPYCILVNPQQKGCNYPNKSISAAVVAWKVCQLLDKVFDVSYTDDLYDIVAIGLQGDLMNLMQPENRYIVSKGINNIKNIGIKSLLAEAKKDTDKIASSDIGYFIAPNINAACRMDQIEVILELLIETEPKKAKELAIKVIELNKERQRIQTRFNEKLIGFVNEKDKCSIIIDDEIGKGFKGLVSGDFSNKFQKAIMILSNDDNDTYSGSYRAYGDLDLKKLLSGIPEIIHVGGHGAAGGVSFKRTDLNKIQTILNEMLTNKIEGENLEYVLKFDISELNEKLIKEVEHFYRLSGKNFEVGKFQVKNICPQKVEVIGSDKNTLRLPCVPMDRTYFLDEDDIQDMKPAATLMKFRTNKDYFDKKVVGKEIEVVGTLNFNEFTLWKPYKRVLKTNQIFIEDYRFVK